MLQLQFLINSTNGKVFNYTVAKPRVSVGRHEENDIQIQENFISAYHACFLLDEEGQCYLEDRDSSNGTFINGRRIFSREEVFPGDMLRFGSLKCRIREESAAEDLEPTTQIRASDRLAAIEAVQAESGSITSAGDTGFYSFEESIFEEGFAAARNGDPKRIADECSREIQRELDAAQEGLRESEMRLRELNSLIETLKDEEIDAA